MINQSQFDQAKRELAGQDPLTKRVRLSDIEITDQSIANGEIRVAGQSVPVSGKFFNRLGQAVNLQTGLLNRMGKNSDREVQTRLLQAVKGYSETRDGGKEFLLVGNAEQRRISDIVKADKYSRLSNETLFNTAETILNHVPDLHIESIDRGGNGGVSINLIHGQQQGFERLGKDEVFRFGVSLVNGDNQSRVDDFFLRLSCANGAVARQLNTAFEFGRGEDAFRELMSSLQGWAKVGFVPRTFKDRLETAMKTNASFAEMERVMNAVTGQLKESDPDFKARLEAAVRGTHFHEYDATVKRIMQKGHNPLTLSDAQKKFINSGTTVWDLVNELTWLGSHQSTFEFENNKRFKVEGGNLFSKTWDLQHADLASI
jgi:hypothetical protein